MKAVILCAGYATRLYPLTLNKPKALLRIGERVLIDYIIEKIPSAVDEIIVVSNDKFYDDFLKWGESYEKVKILNDGCNTNETRLGGVGDLAFAINEEKIDDDILVILGDNLFDFSLDEFVDFFCEKKSFVVGLFNLDSLEDAKNFGIVNLERDKIVSFEEKPERPKSKLISTGLYIFPKKNVKDIVKYMETDGSKEGIGYLIPYFIDLQDNYGFFFEGKWYDIGDKKTYRMIRETW